MVFSSISFIFFILPLALLLDASARAMKSVNWRNVMLLTVSLLFYIWGEAANVFLLLGLGIFNYYAGWKLTQKHGNRTFFIVAVVINLGVLFYYKYAAWFVTLIIPGISIDNHAMPLGISFFTFHALSYLIDIYRRQIEPASNARDFLTYFCMFPHLVAGPIVRYAHISGELTKRGPDWGLFNFGIYRFLIGLNKKVIIANSAALLADTAFTNSAATGLSSLDAWIGILAYTVQIYFDFSGYSDMAIGLAAMLGFRFAENFRRPYSSASIKEFWRRWHISLSSWFRDYLYISLGGSRAGEWATYRNLLIVFFLCGLWHGANMTFVIWGLWHGCFLIFERLKLIDTLIKKTPFFIMRIYTLLVVMIGWVFFRSSNLSEAFIYLQQMFTFNNFNVSLNYYSINMVVMFIGIIVCLIPDRFISQPTSDKVENKVGAFSFSAYLFQIIFAIVSFTILLTSTRNPFIYFNF